MDLSWKTTLVTGAGRGIGRAIALSLGKIGANVAVDYHSSKRKLDEISSTVKLLVRNGCITGQVINPNGGLYI